MMRYEVISDADGKYAALEIEGEFKVSITEDEYGIYHIDAEMVSEGGQLRGPALVQWEGWVE